MGSNKKKVSAPKAAKGAKPFVASRSLLPRAETSDSRIAWRFCHVDHAGPWGFGDLTFAQIMDKLQAFESMTCREIFDNGEEPGKHYDVANLPNRVAIDRLEELTLGDMTKISRLRLGGKIRLYGFLEGNVFHLVWWDPEHQVWPSTRR
ncbi:hypothetical protein [Planotetraspora sp. GP83]|uniref:hypothetical protein n=1 Tax=Planotetraspora sp. GP83 TaxID=3156264 RepID=UPI0035171930